MVSLSATKLSLGRQWKALQHAHARACTRRRCHRASGSCSKPSHVCGKSCIATACPAAPTQGARGPSLFGRGRILATGCNVRHVTSHVRRGPAPPRKRKPPALPRMQELNAGKDLSLLDCSTVRPKDQRTTTPWIRTWFLRRCSAATGEESERGLWRALSFMTRDMQECCAGCSLAKPQAEAGAGQRWA